MSHTTQSRKGRVLAALSTIFCLIFVGASVTRIIHRLTQPSAEERSRAMQKGLESYLASKASDPTNPLSPFYRPK